MKNKYSSGRCGRCLQCNGFLYSAIFDAKKNCIYTMQDKVKCMNCGRHYVLQDGKMEIWPHAISYYQLKFNKKQGVISC